jgi:hypothetical protein
VIYELLKDFITIIFEIISNPSSLTRASAIITGKKVPKIPGPLLQVLLGHQKLYTVQALNI